MNTCIVCGKEVHGDDGYATDGKIFVCRKCTEIQTLRTITVYIGNSGVDSNLVYKREPPIEMESSLVNQTKATIDYVGGFSTGAAINHIYDECEQIWYETHDKSEVHSKFTERVKELEAHTGKTAEELGIYEPNFENSEASIEAEYSLVNQTDYSSVSKAETVLKADYDSEIDADIENMSEEDFMSKYCDDGYAIGKWVKAHSDDFSLESRVI